VRASARKSQLAPATAVFRLQRNAINRAAQREIVVAALRSAAHGETTLGTLINYGLSLNIVNWPLPR